MGQGLVLGRDLFRLFPRVRSREVIGRLAHSLGFIAVFLDPLGLGHAAVVPSIDDLRLWPSTGGGYSLALNCVRSPHGQLVRLNAGALERTTVAIAALR